MFGNVVNTLSSAAQTHIALVGTSVTIDLAGLAQHLRTEGI